MWFVIQHIYTFMGCKIYNGCIDDSVAIQGQPVPISRDHIRYFAGENLRSSAKNN